MAVARNAGNSVLLLCEQGKLCFKKKKELLRWPLESWVCEATRKKGSVGWQLGGADELLKVYCNDPGSRWIWYINISGM